MGHWAFDSFKYGESGDCYNIASRALWACHLYQRVSILTHLLCLYILYFNVQDGNGACIGRAQQGGRGSTGRFLLLPSAARGGSAYCTARGSIMHGARKHTERCDRARSVKTFHFYHRHVKPQWPTRTDWLLIYEPGLDKERPSLHSWRLARMQVVVCVRACHKPLVEQREFKHSWLQQIFIQELCSHPQPRSLLSSTPDSTAKGCRQRHLLPRWCVPFSGYLWPQVSFQITNFVGFFSCLPKSQLCQSQWSRIMSKPSSPQHVPRTSNRASLTRWRTRVSPTTRSGASLTSRVNRGSSQHHQFSSSSSSSNSNNSSNLKGQSVASLVLNIYHHV